MRQYVAALAAWSLLWTGAFGQYEELQALGATVDLQSEEPNGLEVIVQASKLKINDENVSVFTKFPRINGLILARSELTDVGAAKLSKLPNLISLNLRYTNVSGSFLTKWPQPNLRFLVLQGCPVTDESIRDICQVPTLETLNVRNTAISDNGVACLPRLKRLEMLLMGGTKVTDAGLKSIGGCMRLRVLSLNDTTIGDAGIKLIMPLPIEQLDLQGTSVSDKCVPDLIQMKSLMRITTAGTRMTQQGREALMRQFPMLEIIN